ncbi:MAG: hypothetical protein HPY66_0149 [Firmicutes bacterium]|nr:hypothetical protein [Bacillota bacterium]MDI6705442.1 Na+/H+ antiporter subunit E [Bacillota bacterium]
MGKYSKGRIAFWSIALLIFWVAVSGKIKIHDIMLAVLIIGFTLYMASRMNPETFRLRGAGPPPVKRMFYALLYVICITIEIIKANVHVASVILSPRLKISPGLVRYRHGFSSRFSSFLYANSITLTPGTLTVGLDEEDVTVHVLEESNKDALADWKVERVLKKMEVKEK